MPANSLKPTNFNNNKYQLESCDDVASETWIWKCFFVAMIVKLYGGDWKKQKTS
jgi:hypothetical protein